MKISKIYSNGLFHDTKFNSCFNIVLGQIKKPEHKETDPHDVGKTILINLIDFLLLKEIDNDHFLRKNKTFHNNIFYLEIELNDGGYITIRREVEHPTKIYFKIHAEKDQDFRELDLDEWDIDLTIEKAKVKLNSILGFDVLLNWNYRKTVSYFLRNQNDYNDVFQLQKFSIGKHIEWKPFLFELLGFDGATAKEKYEVDNDIEDYENKIKELKKEYSVDKGDYDKVAGKILINEKEVKEISKNIDNFNFYEYEKDLISDLINNIEKDISYYNTQIYNLMYQQEKIRETLSKKITFNLKDVKEIFEDVKIYFSDQLVKDYEELLEFNKKITTDRNALLEERSKKIKEELNNLQDKLEILNKKRESMLKVLKDRESFNKFKEYQKELSEKEAELIRLKYQLEKIEESNQLQKQVDLKNERLKELSQSLRNQIKESNPVYTKIREIFNEIVFKTIHKYAILSIKQNQENNLEFYAEITKENKIETTSESEGNTYKKLLCSAFDLAILAAYSDSSFFRFVYHDGILEGLDFRRKEDLIMFEKEFCQKYNIQIINTVIETDLPPVIGSPKRLITDEDIVLKLHDDGPSGTLFKRIF